MNKSWIFLTPERMGWSKWPRKRRMKFKKRLRARLKGYAGVEFMSVETVIAISKPKEEYVDVCCHIRE